MKITYILFVILLSKISYSQNYISNRFCTMSLNDSNVLLNNKWVEITGTRTYELSDKIEIKKYEKEKLEKNIYQFNRNNIIITDKDGRTNVYDLTLFIEYSYPYCYFYTPRSKTIMDNCRWRIMGLTTEGILIVNIYCCKYKKRFEKKNKCKTVYVETRFLIVDNDDF
jgi:hypothetical protein